MDKYTKFENEIKSLDYIRVPYETIYDYFPNASSFDLIEGLRIILVHNHPSGRLLPSREDKLSTQKMREAGNLVGIELLDHLIVGDKKGHYFSFREENILNNNFYLELLREERKPYER